MYDLWPVAVEKKLAEVELRRRADGGGGGRERCSRIVDVGIYTFVTLTFLKRVCGSACILDGVGQRPNG